MRSPSSIRLTICGVNGVSFSYSAISTLWQNDESGWNMSVSDMDYPCFVRTMWVAFGVGTCSLTR